MLSQELKGSARAGCSVASPSEVRRMGTASLCWLAALALFLAPIVVRNQSWHRPY